MNEMTAIPYQRGIEDVTRDIKVQTGQFLRTGIEIGRLLFEAKAMVEPGKWGAYIEEQLPFSQSWANNYMKLYKEYGCDQTSLFGDSHAFMNLRPTQALELLALPQEVREEFLENHDVENMSTRELRKEVQAELEKTQAALRDAEHDKLVLQQQVASLESTESAWEEEIRKLQEKVKAAEEAKGKAQEKCGTLSGQVLAAEKKAKDAEARARDSSKKLEQLKKNPQIPENVMAEMQQRFTAEADKKAAEAAQKTVDKLSGELKKAEAARVAAEEALAAARKQTQLSDPDAAVFKTLFQQVQEDFNRMKGCLVKVNGKDPELGGKFKAAVEALLEKMRGEM